MTLLEREQETDVFAELESEVRNYCRQWPVVFERARGSWLYDRAGRPYLDFFVGAGTLNYGHNHPSLKRVLIEYLTGDHIVHSLDMFTVAKAEFLATLSEVILRPRGLEYRVQFPGPAGTTAVEAALKVARKVTGHADVACFAQGFHGMTLGALAVSSNHAARRAAGTRLPHAYRLPFDCDDALELLESRLDHGLAAVIVETVQGEGGVRPARAEWLRALAEMCRNHGVPLIVDDVQMGCGRTGPFFSFESAEIVPDIVCLSKSLSGYGLPLALTLIRPELDAWAPGEHSGTFRGFNPAMATGAAALRRFWTDDRLERNTRLSGRRINAALNALVDEIGPARVCTRGRGLARGLAFTDPDLAPRVAAAAFEGGLLVETAGPLDEVVKLLPPLTISDDELEQGLELLAKAVRTVC